MSKLKLIKDRIAEIVIEANNNQESHEKYERQERKASILNSKLKYLDKDLDKDFDDELESINAIRNDLESLKKASVQRLNNYIDKEQLEEKNNQTTQEYLNLIASFNEEGGNFFDVMVDFTSYYPGGTKTLHSIIHHMNKKGANIQIVYENNKERETKKTVDGYDAKFFIVMPSSSYGEFNDLTHKDRSEPRYDVIGERDDYFYFNHLNKDLSLDDIKSILKEYMERPSKERLSVDYDLLSHSIGIGAVKLYGSNYKSQKKIENAVKKYFSQVRNLENQKIIEEFNLVSESVTPLSESKRRQNEEIVRKMEIQEKAVKKSFKRK